MLMLVGLVNIGLSWLTLDVVLANDLAGVIVGATVHVLVLCYGAILCATTYIALRNEKDGVGLGELARRFER
jgi:hypothetical protein